jgi:hypothetical protein
VGGYAGIGQPAKGGMTQTPSLCVCSVAVQVRYPASLPTLHLGVSGTHFVAIAGCQQSPLEALLLKRGLRGPGWCLLTGATRKEGGNQVSGGVLDDKWYGFSRVVCVCGCGCVYVCVSV